MNSFLAAFANCSPIMLRIVYYIHEYNGGMASSVRLLTRALGMRLGGSVPQLFSEGA